jgi:hypothetical protein
MRFLILEISIQYQRKPARCHRTTVSGVTTKSACFSRTRTDEKQPEEPVEYVKPWARMTPFQHGQRLA